MYDDGSFESASRPQQEMSEQYKIVKRPLRKIQPAVEKAIKILQIDLDRLDRHKKNIVKFQLLQEWQSLHKEQVNSSRTVQQLKSNIRQLENIRLQVVDEDVEMFDTKVAGIQDNAAVSVREFLQVQNGEVVDADLQGVCDMQGLAGPMSLPVSDHSDWSKSRSLSESTTDVLLLQDQVVASGGHDAQSEQSWGDLKQNLEELNGLIHDFSTLVHDQQSTVDSIEDNVENAQMNVSEGVTHLVTANRLKAAAFPVAGALIGTAVGGPVGLFIGVKAGLAAAGVGSVIGFTSGRFLKKKHNKNLDVELSHLSKEKSHSLPEIPLADETEPLQRSYHEDT